MVGLTAPVAAELARKVDFSGVRSVVDVGGGYGQLLCSVLQAWPAIHGVLFDMAHATAALTPHFSDAGVAVRCENVTGSFLTPFLNFGIDHLRIKVLPIMLPQWSIATSIITLKNRTLSPVASLFIDCARDLARQVLRTTDDTPA